jgi:hypothetical protein
MPMSAISAYLERLPARQAEWKILMADPIALPHMKEGDRRTMVNSWNTTMLKSVPARVAGDRREVRAMSPHVCEYADIPPNGERASRFGGNGEM